MDNVEEYFHRPHYNILRLLLSITGLWPRYTLKKRCAIYLAYLLVLGSGVTFEVLGILEIWRDTVELIDSVPIFGLHVTATLKMISIVSTIPEINILLLKIREYGLSLKWKEEINILHSHAQFGRILGYIYTVVVLAHVAFFQIVALLSKLHDMKSSQNVSRDDNVQIGLPFRVNYMVDLDTYYIPIYIHTASCNLFFSLLMTTFDVLYLTLTQHCCALFKALRYRFESAYKVENGDSQQIPTKDQIRSNIVYSVRRHAEAIEFATIMESMHRLPLFVHIGANVSVLSILGFQLVTHPGEIERLLKHAAYFSALLMNTFFENWQGQQIIDSSEKVFESAYNAEWYNMSEEQKKFLMTTMMLSSKSFKMTAGNIVALSYINFNAVIRASSSYFMFLRSMQ